MTLRNQGGGNVQGARVTEEFEAAVAFGGKTAWYDDALYHYAQWAARSGTGYYDDNGDLQLEPDYGKAIELYERLLEEFRKGETRYYDAAKNAIRNITDPQISLSVANIYLPGSQAEIQLNWRNIEGVKINIYPVNLNQDVEFKDARSGPWQWLNAIEVGEKGSLQTINRDDGPKRIHYPVNRKIRLETEVPMGAYLVEATGGGHSARDLLLISDVSLVLKTSGRRTLGYFNEAIGGGPVAEAEMVVWEHFYDGRKWHWEKHSTTTDADGLILFDQLQSRQNRQIFASAVSAERQAFAIASGGSGYRAAERQWKVFAYPDRPAYRPVEPVFWKIIARSQLDGAYEVPTDAEIRYRIDDPRGSKVDEGVLALNAFGAAWGKLETGAEWPLGMYRITFSAVESKGNIGGATLFRLEEYKLPELKVGIHLGSGGEEDDERTAYRIGDSISGTIDAEYYFGGSVPDAEVELTVYQRPFFHWFRQAREFGWFYDDIDHPGWVRYGGRGTRVLSESLRTDPNGRAVFSFDTPRYSEEDYEYTIEARVVDASRREIIANRTIRVTRQSYYVYLNPEHRVYQPGDEAEVAIRTADANDRPISAEGRLRLTRERWREVWVDNRGREITGLQMQELRKKTERRFYFGATASDYRLKDQGYHIEEMDVAIVRTDAAGEAVYSIKIAKEGYYRVAWVSTEKTGQPIKSDTAFWAGSEDDVEIGYRPGGVSIIVDKDTFRVGERAPIMIAAPVAGRFILFTVGAEELISYRLVRMDGTVKLLYLDVREEHVPNSFLDAHMVSNGEMFFQQEQIVVPPTGNFLDIDVTADAEGYGPGETGHYRIRVTDDGGNPVSAEVSLALVDEAVYYIQPELAGDIRQFFYGSKRSYGLGMGSTFAQKPYFRFRPETDDENSLSEQEAVSAGDEVLTLESFDSAAPRSKAMAMDSAAAPMAVAEGGANGMAGVGGSDGNGEEPAVAVRTDFRSTVFWQPDIVTGEDGTAEVEVTFPDSLTNWKAVARGVARTNRFGDGSVERQTRLPLIARLQAPRFFVEGDELILSGIFNNNTGLDMPLEAVLEVDEHLIAEGPFDENGDLLTGESSGLVVAANSPLRVDWKVTVRRAGESKIKLVGMNRQFSDAMEKVIPVYEHGISKFVAKSGKIREDSVKISLNLPKERRKDSTRLTVRVTPSMAVTMLDALPYLVDFPYGCNEQTLSRFLPAVIVAKTLNDLGLHREQIAARIFGGVEKESVPETHSGSSHGLEELDAVVASGLKLLYDSQNRSGGWGWWKDGDDDAFMTAYVVWGLSLAVEAGIEVDARVLRRARSFLGSALVGAEGAFDMQAWLLHALASRSASGDNPRPTKEEATAFLNLMKNRDHLNAYTRSLLALTAHYFGFSEDAQLLVRNLRNGVKVDERPDQSILITGADGSSEGVISTAHWGNDGIYWRWSEGGAEATAFALMAMLMIDPESDLVEPATQWLIKNRRGANWSNTRDTAIAVLALNSYLEVSGELDAVAEYELIANGQSISRVSVTEENILTAPSVYSIDNAFVNDGLNEFVINRTGGDGALYFSVHAEFFSLEEPVTPVGNEIFAERFYYRLKAVPTLLKGFVEEKVVLSDGDSLASGDRVEVVIVIEGKNNYEYLVFEDLKPAGFEALQLRSGEPILARELKASEVIVASSGAGEDITPILDGPDRYTGRQRVVYQELRDRKVACFIDKLPEGFWEIRYRMRAETPGGFHALPVLGSAMYVPEIRANGSEMRFTVTD
jgi:uncharacterized protein YfaS (alpha-2-macroglobulin family)